jgi:hypothetical protein
LAAVERGSSEENAMLFTVLQGLYRVASALGGGVGMMMLYRFAQTGAVLWLPYVALFLGGAVLLLWLAKQLPERELPRLRNTTFFHRVLNALYR